MFTIDNKKRILIARRPLWKKNSPGLWCNSVSGTNAKGETYESNIIKEAHEELGINLDLTRLKFITTVYLESNTKHFVGIFTYLIRLEDILHVNTEEVEATKWISIEELESELVNNPQKFTRNFSKIWDIIRPTI